MKNLIITTVNNGWLVEVHPSASCDVYQSTGCRHVFCDIKELQEKLPELLGLNENTGKATISQIRKAFNVHQDQIEEAELCQQVAIARAREKL